MYRFSLFFTSDRNSWSESHVLTQTTDRATAEGQSQNLAALRATLLGTNARIIACRVSEVGKPRNARLIDLGAPTLEAPNFTNPAEGQTTADSPHVAVVVRVSGTDTEGNLHQGRIFLSGIPDELVTVRGSSPQLKVTPAWNTRFVNYRNQLENVSAGFKVTTRLAKVDVNGVTVSNTPPGEIGLRFAPVTPLPAVNNFVYVSGFVLGSPFSKPLKGRYQVSRVDAPVSPDTSYTMYLRNSQGIDPLGFTELGAFQEKDSEYIKYQSMSIGFATHRDRGGSYGLQRGRSRTTKR